MSEHAETKRHFRLAKVQGTPLVAPSAAHAQKWSRQFEEVLPISYSANPRLVNAFKVGADPEFVFADLERGIRADAERFGLKTGIAFGADMNGRLVELRPQASRFGLDVLASILEELRWLQAYKRDTAGYAWRAGAFLYKDGIGGHVHLGRKRELKRIREWARHFNASHGRNARPRAEVDVPLQPEAIRRMDLIFYALTELGVYNKSQVGLRQHGDQHGQQYGLPGDIRMQAHGYEYRAYPSWLDHPLSAYLAIVLTKLAAYDPEVLPNPSKMPQNPEVCLRLVRNFLAYYKGRDDDAAIAHAALHKQGVPVYLGDDFKQRWGIGYADVAIPAYIPDMIPGHDLTKRELFKHLTEGTTLEVASPRLTWEGRIPDDYVCCLDYIESTRGMRGLGELAFELFSHRAIPVRLVCGNDGPDFVIARQFKLKGEGRQLAHRFGVRVRQGGNMVSVPAAWREPAMLKKTKQLLTALLPLWTAEQLQAKNFKPHAETPRNVRYAGQLLVGGA